MRKLASPPAKKNFSDMNVHHHGHSKSMLEKSSLSSGLNTSKFRPDHKIRLIETLELDEIQSE